jgi:fatty acid CoA ligase FadD9
MGFAAIHGENSDLLRAADLTLDRFLSPDLLTSVDTIGPLDSGDPQYVVLTGANGFLGRFLCLEWLERMATRGGRLACICRGRDRDDAASRLRKAFDSGDEGLLARFDELAAKHLDVFAGDLGQKMLGLDQEAWDTLAARADLIVHPAALVNHRLSYRQLFQPNVVGTAEIIALALTGHRKRIVNISTIAAARSASGSLVSEQSDVRAAIPVWSVSDDDQYAGGYAASKWAAEVLLRDAAERFGIPVANFRANMILAHRDYPGQLNVPDIFTRFVVSLILTGIAPASFYTGDARRAHYEGLPADFVARAVAGIGEACRTGFHTFHVVNPHDDGISLDTFVDWIEAEGHAIERLADYANWRARFEQSLRSLPESLRAGTSLPVISMFDAPTPVAAETDAAPDFVDAVARILGEGSLPHLDRALIRKYLSDIEHLGLVEAQAG